MTKILMTLWFLSGFIPCLIVAVFDFKLYRKRKWEGFTRDSDIWGKVLNKEEAKKDFIRSYILVMGIGTFFGVFTPIAIYVILLHDRHKENNHENV